ncbi:hypothetical protein [Oxalicibacterium faecigallinarum]|uniref:hypothetical protein n=1 Tax=Oxalicibacterium faecigallinarum TaxID=573741 RepID=UPI00166DDFEA|nr:hypothetical protein [Oxalicibacterium faecigallinarum]
MSRTKRKDQAAALQPAAFLYALSDGGNKKGDALHRLLSKKADPVMASTVCVPPVLP